MENGNDLLKRKKLEITAIVAKACNVQQCDNQYSDEILKSLFSSGGLVMTSPQQEPPKMHMLTMDSLYDFHKGESIKPGNIKLNIRHLVESLPELTAACVGIALDIPILKVCAALNIWKMLRDITTVEITKEQAIAVVALWENCDQHQRIELKKGFDCFHSLCSKIDVSECTWEHYLKIIDELVELGSIKLDDSSIRCCEWVSRKYTR